MNRTTPKLHIGIFAMVFAMLAMVSCAPYWPQFRGPDQNMIAKEKSLPQVWDEDTNIKWKVPLDAEAWASPVVMVDKIFISSAVPVEIQSPGESHEADTGVKGEEQDPLQDVYRWQVTCYDLKTGMQLWSHVCREGHPRVGKNPATNYAGETPVTDGKRLYAYFGMTGIYCLSLKGELLWEKDLGAYRTRNDWGSGSSPLVYKGRVFVQVDNEEHSFLVALDSETGKEIWRADRDEKTNYSTPFLWKNRNRTELVAGGKTARSYDPETGEVFWELQLDGKYNIPSPVGDRDYLYLGNTAWRDIPGTLFCVRAGAMGDITPDADETKSNGVVWADKDAPTANPSPLLYEGHLYLVSSNGGEITCYNAFTGERVYQEKIQGVAGCWASPWAHEGMICFTDEKGTTRMFRAGRQFEPVQENRLDDKFWASMAVAGKDYLFRGSEKLYCIGR